MKTEEQVTKELIDVMTETMKESGLGVQDGVQAIMNATFQVVGICGAALGEKPEEFLVFLLEQSLEQIKNK